MEYRSRARYKHPVHTSVSDEIDSLIRKLQAQQECTRAEALRLALHAGIAALELA